MGNDCLEALASAIGDYEDAVVENNTRKSIKISLGERGFVHT